MMKTYLEPARDIPVRSYDVVVAGGGTGGVVAAIAAARTGARTALVESKGYVGGIVTEGGTALHSYFNLWKAFPGVPRTQLVRGIPQEIIDRLLAAGGTAGHVEVDEGWDYDSVCTSIDTEIYKCVVHSMLLEAGVEVMVNTMLVGAVTDGGTIRGALVESRSGRELLEAASFIDATGYGDLAAHAGAQFTDPNDYSVANSIGVGGVDIDTYISWLRERDGIADYAETVLPDGSRQVVRVSAKKRVMPAEFVALLDKLGMVMVTTVVHKDHFMFIKFNYKMADSVVGPEGRDAQAAAEHVLRARQLEGIAALRRFIPGCGNAYIARTSPSICIRRARCITCDYDVNIDDVINGNHFRDDIMYYGFHDLAPRYQIRDGGSYGIPLRALTVAGLDNLFAIGMMVTSEYYAHMSTRNTVCCMGQGQGAGTAAALCAQNGWDARTLLIDVLRKTLLASDVYLG